MPLPYSGTPVLHRVFPAPLKGSQDDTNYLRRSASPLHPRTSTGGLHQLLHLAYLIWRVIFRQFYDTISHKWLPTGDGNQPRTLYIAGGPFDRSPRLFRVGQLIHTLDRVPNGPLPTSGQVAAPVRRLSLPGPTVPSVGIDIPDSKCHLASAG